MNNCLIKCGENIAKRVWNTLTSKWVSPFHLMVMMVLGCSTPVIYNTLCQVTLKRLSGNGQWHSLNCSNETHKSREPTSHGQLSQLYYIYICYCQADSVMNYTVCNFIKGGIQWCGNGMPIMVTLGLSKLKVEIKSCRKIMEYSLIC